MDDQFRQDIARAEHSGLAASPQLVLHLMLCIQHWHRTGWLAQIVEMPFETLVELAQGGDVLRMTPGQD